jgi:hypothetical protein
MAKSSYAQWPLNWLHKKLMEIDQCVLCGSVQDQWQLGLKEIKTKVVK